MKPLVLFLLLASAVRAQYTPFPGAVNSTSGGSPGVWTMAQNNAEFNDSSCTSCTVTLTSAGTIGNYPVLVFGVNSSATVTGVSGGGSTWTVVSGCELSGGGSIGNSYCAWGTPYTSSPSTLTVSLGTSATVSGFYYEGNWSGSGSCTLDTSGTQNNSSASTSMPGVALSLTGTSDFIAQFLMTAGGTPSAISSPYSYFHNGSFRGTGAYINTSSGAAPTFTNSNSQASIVAALALSCTGGAAPSFTLTQSPQKFSCTFTDAATTHACTVTLTSTSAGQFIIVGIGMFYNGTNTTAPSYASVSGDTSLQHCPSTGSTPFGIVQNTGGTGHNFTLLDCAYTTSAVGGTTSITVTMNTPSVNTGATSAIDLQVAVGTKSSGSISLDATNSVGYSASSPCTSCAFPSLTLTGTNDYIFLETVVDNSFSALSSPWTNPSALELTNVGAGFFGAINQTSYSAPSISQSSGYAVMAGLAIK